jgi:HD-GYP domain-containing protein (c-di-GMP phosphodiesterase class II)
MRILPTMMCQSGMFLGKAIYTEEGQVLVGHRVELTDNMIRKLSQLGIDYLHIDDPRTDDILIEDPIHEETRSMLRFSLGKIFERFGATAGISFSRITTTSSIGKLFQEGMSRVIDDLYSHKNDAVMLTSLNLLPPNNMEQHFCQNALNVCVYVTKLAMADGSFNRDELMSIGLGALLHDVGNVNIPLQLLEKKAHLTPNEFMEIKKHTEYGFQLLKDEIGIPLIAANCALQHHERMNGSGYPYGLAGDQIHPYARYIGMFDSYDAMIHPRSYRQAMPPHHALEVLYANAGTLYDINMVKLFRNNVAIFPLGLSVSLSTGEKGIVSRLNLSSMQRPVVRVLRDASGIELKEPYEIDLSYTLNIIINEIGEQLVV